MIKYKCGHTSKGIILMNSDVLSMATYLQWAEDEDNLTTEKECFDCFLKRIRK